MTRLQPHLALLLAALLGSSACSDGPTTPTSPTGSQPPAAVTTPVRVTFLGAVGPGGSVSRTFYAQIPGTATAVLSSISPATALTIGLGIPRADGTGCLLAHSATAGGGAATQISGAVSVGTYCVQVFAPAQTANSVTFTVVVEHP